VRSEIGDHDANRCAQHGERDPQGIHLVRVDGTKVCERSGRPTVRRWLCGWAGGVRRDRGEQWADVAFGG